MWRLVTQPPLPSKQTKNGNKQLRPRRRPSSRMTTARGKPWQLIMAISNLDDPNETEHRCCCSVVTRSDCNRVTGWPHDRVASRIELLAGLMEFYLNISAKFSNHKKLDLAPTNRCWQMFVQLRQARKDPARWFTVTTRFPRWTKWKSRPSSVFPLLRCADACIRWHFHWQATRGKRSRGKFKYISLFIFRTCSFG